ncbi:jg7679 [Pararge aegeria aegeria]|uniref:Jg7679 protein n=1 Tax=Pararge aegeria aegeria TaxID=348720 RepID=A0A8S4S3R4_9NEOP|nr:jg7679 [Pararge aegeria aegeria]
MRCHLIKSQIVLPGIIHWLREQRITRKGRVGPSVKTFGRARGGQMIALMSERIEPTPPTPDEVFSQSLNVGRINL